MAQLSCYICYYRVHSEILAYFCYSTIQIQIKLCMYVVTLELQLNETIRPHHKGIQK